MHYLMMISDKTDMVFRLEFLMRTIKKFSYNKPVVFSVIVNGNKQGLLKKPLKLSKGNINNNYISLNSEVYFCPYHWSIPAPSRWFIEPKMDNCVFIDVDMIACSDLSPLYDLEKDVIHGVTAFDCQFNSHNKIKQNQWNLIGFSEDDLKYYFNFGMLVVPSKYMLDIGNNMIGNLPKIIKIFKEHYYFAGQIALAYTLKEMGLKRNVLPNKFNWYDLFPVTNMKDVIFLHYFTNQDFVNSKIKLRSIKGNDYLNIINNMANEIYNKNLFKIF